MFFWCQFLDTWRLWDVQWHTTGVFTAVSSGHQLPSITRYIKHRFVHIHCSFNLTFAAPGVDSSPWGGRVDPGEIEIAWFQLNDKLWISSLHFYKPLAINAFVSLSILFSVFQVFCTLQHLQVSNNYKDHFGEEP